MNLPMKEGRPQIQISKNTLVGLAFVGPSALCILFFMLIPAVMSFHYCLTDWNGVSSSYNYIGLENFRRVISAPGFDRLIYNTIFLLILYVPVLNILCILLSVALYDIGRLASFYKVTVYLPSLMSMVVVGLIWRTIYNPVIGPLARLFEWIGFPDLMPDLLGSRGTVMYALSISIIWYAIGFYSLVYLGGLSNIPNELYEAADIDGAGRLHRLFSITLPLLMPSITINVVVSIIGILLEFQLPLVLTGGGPGYSSQTMALRAYIYATREQRPGMSMALSVLLTIVAVTVSVIMTNILRKKEVEN